jgi:hypothetical protein
MPPPALTTLFCAPSDVEDYLSVEGVNLRLDDDASATGQYIQATQTVPVGSLSVPIMPLQAAIPAGDRLTFYGANMPSESAAIVQSAAGISATSLMVAALAQTIFAGAVAIDSGVNLVEYQRIITEISAATSEVRSFVAVKYDDSELVKSWSIWRCTRIIAAYRLCRRRTNACPVTVEEDYKAALKELKEYQYGARYVDDAGLRTTEAPAWSNVRVDQFGYDFQKVRVEQCISESTPTQYPQHADWLAQFSYEI